MNGRVRFAVFNDYYLAEDWFVDDITLIGHNLLGPSCTEYTKNGLKVNQMWEEYGLPYNSWKNA